MSKHAVVWIMRRDKLQKSTAMTKKQSSTKRRPRRNGWLAVSPLLVLVGLLVSLSLITGDPYKVSLPVVFIATAAYALFTTRGLSIDERLTQFSRGAGSSGLLLMVWIFVLAGAFAESAKQMGAISATVDLTLLLLPEGMLLAGLFLAACFVSLAIGTSVGTIVALVPVAVGLASRTDMSLPLITASVAGGAFFGDNLSFISDTTVAATRTQGCRLSDKFRVNFRIVLPAAIITFMAYVVMGQGGAPLPEAGSVDWLKVLPYVAVLLTAVMGLNVTVVLMMGCLLTGAVGMAMGCYDLMGWMQSMAVGISGMGELIVISLLAGGLLELIRYNGGITFLLRMLTRRIRGKRGAELSIAALVSITNVCTANNTIAILSVGKLANDIAERYGVDKRKSASLLDTFSCCVQGLLPYGAQMLMAAGLASVSPMEIIPYLYYPMVMGFIALLAIFLRYPRRYS